MSSVVPEEREDEKKEEPRGNDGDEIAEMSGPFWREEKGGKPEKTEEEEKEIP